MMVAVFLILFLAVPVIALEHHFQPRFTQINGEWGVWYSPGRYTDRREFIYIKDLIKWFTKQKEQ